MFSFLSKKIYNFSRYYAFIIAAVFFILGIYTGHIYWGAGQILNTVQKRADDPNLLFTNPLLSCGVSENTEFSEYKPLEKIINDRIKKADTKGTSVVSVYYKDLNTGRWFGINETAVYSPASLLKVPIMIAFLKEAESNPGVLNQRIYFGNQPISSYTEYYKSNGDIKAGNYYTVDQLITSMIEHSDNVATILLFQNVDRNSLIEVMTDIGLKPPADDKSAGTDDYMTVKSYSFLFRLLYNSTYLNRDMSEKALKLLSQTDFYNGLTQGVPNSLKVSHKFGERTVFGSSGHPQVEELHDCGIVYDQQHPYLLCVMTKGPDFKVLSSIIGSISSAVYDNVK